MTTQGTESTPTTPPPSEPEYAIRFHVPYPRGERDKKSVALRIFMVIPISIVLGTIAVGGGYAVGWINSTWVFFVGGTTGILTLGPALMIIFQEKYPRWWFDFNLQLLKFGARVTSYLFLLRDEYPATDSEQSIQLEADYPNVERDLNRWYPIFKWILAIPHVIVLGFLFIGVLIAIVVAWFSILITGSYPRGLFNYVVGVMRWNYRVTAYAFLLNTDVYPPFSLD